MPWAVRGPLGASGGGVRAEGGGEGGRVAGKCTWLVARGGVALLGNLRAAFTRDLRLGSAKPA